MGLLDASGAMVAPCEYTALTPFYEGKALLTQSTPKGDRVVGCIDEQGIFHRFLKIIIPFKDRLSIPTEFSL